MKRYIIMAIVAASMALTAAGAPLRLDIYRDEQPTDTVGNSKYYLIAVTEPGARAWIAGKECKVYRTGSFGAELKLKEGENKVSVKVKEGKREAKRDVRLVYVPRAKSAAVAETVRELAEPLNVVSKEFAYLQYGNGGDRLGGSKMNFLAPGVEMTAVGETDRLYKVALGGTRWAYVPKDEVEAGGNGQQTVNTGSARIVNTGRCDRVSLAVPARLAYYTRSEIDPSTIKVTLYGAMNNTNWLTQENKTEMIEWVDLQQEESDVLTVVIRLKDKYQWGYSVGYEEGRLVIDVRHRPKSLEVKDLVIGLDAGHGGEYRGAVSPSGLTEKEVNLDIVLKAARMLEELGAKVVLTRDSDTGPSMTERKRTWLAGGVDIAVSVHNNASGNPLVPMGTSAYYKHISNRALAKALHDSMLESGVANFGLTGNFNFSLNGPTDYPNALVEALFMSSLPEEELLADESYRTKIAERIVKGLQNYLEKVKRSLK